MVMAMISIAWPVWLSVVPANTENRSGYPIPTASDEFLVRVRYWLVSGGKMTRQAFGTTVSRKDAPRDCRPRLDLSLMDQQNPGADDFRDEGRGVGRERHRQGDEFGDHARAAG